MSGCSVPASKRSDLVFENVQVVAEGSSGQFAIRELGLGLAEQMLADVRKRARHAAGYLMGDPNA